MRPKAITPPEKRHVMNENLCGTAIYAHLHRVAGNKGLEENHALSIANATRAPRKANL